MCLQMLYELLTHNPPWGDQAPNDTMRMVVGNKRPSMEQEHEIEAPDGWCQCMRSCWAQSATDRPELSSVLDQLVLMKQLHSEEMDTRRAGWFRNATVANPIRSTEFNQSTPALSKSIRSTALDRSFRSTQALSSTPTMGYSDSSTMSMDHEIPSKRQTTDMIRF